MSMSQDFSADIQQVLETIKCRVLCKYRQLKRASVKMNILETSGSELVEQIVTPA